MKMCLQVLDLIMNNYHPRFDEDVFSVDVMTLWMEDIFPHIHIKSESLNEKMFLYFKSNSDMCHHHSKNILLSTDIL